MTGTGEQLSWRLGEIWTRPGLRHNEVGGENCHNLNIVTHFLAPCSAELEIKRPDIYGYRNLIVLPTNAEPPTFFPDGVYENTNLNDATIFTNGNSEIGARSGCYDIFLPDEETIAVSNIRTGSRVRSPLSKVQKIDESPGSPIQRRDVVKRQQSIKSKSPLLSTSVNLRQHLHRAYRPVFFVIYERPSVIDHLTECESFAAFCKRQNICPVMFLNQETDLFEGRICTSLFQNFDIFCLTTNGYLSKTLPDEPSDHPVAQKSTREESRLRRSADENTKSLLTVILDILFQTKRRLYVPALICSQQILRVLLVALVDPLMINFFAQSRKMQGDFSANSSVSLASR
ncbi:hypothetical protein TSMEX_010402 [Taenia solium]|eukprot:TsM_000295600 transcript=TsM_000295600 gene=TsM_000295600